jgi:hypothetical protein
MSRRHYFLAPAAFVLAGCGANVIAFEGGGGDDPTLGSIRMLSDFEPGHDLLLSRNAAWDGSWAISSDGSPGGVQQEFVQELVPSRPNPDGSSSGRAFRITSNGQQMKWGSSWYATLRNDRAVDVSGFAGLVFWARSTSPDGTMVKVSFADQDAYNRVMPLEDQVCDILDDKADGHACADYYAAYIIPGTEWRRFVVPYASLKTLGWGVDHAFDPSRLFAILFSVAPGIAYDQWVDDIAFYAP